MIDERLSWTEHVKLINNKVMKFIGIIRKIHGLITKNTLHTVYYSLIYPHLSYCNIVWESRYSAYLQKIFITQEKFVRLTTSFNYSSPSTPLFKKLNLLVLFSLVCLFINIFIYYICSRNLLCIFLQSTLRFTCTIQYMPLNFGLPFAVLHNVSFLLTEVYYFGIHFII